MKNAFSINRLAEMFEHDRRKVTRTLAKVEPVATKGRSKLYTPAQYMNAFAAGAEDEDGKPLDLSRERALLARAQRRLTEQTIAAKEAAADDLAWQDAVISAVCFVCRERMKLIGQWLYAEFGDRATSAQASEWGLGIGHQLQTDLLAAAREARQNNVALTDPTTVLKLMGAIVEEETADA